MNNISDALPTKMRIKRELMKLLSFYSATATLLVEKNGVVAWALGSSTL
jgi:hypothetical protein